MDELEFRQRVYADPDNPGPEVLEAAASDPALLAILKQARAMERDLHSVANGIEPPADLHARLRALPESDPQSGAKPERSNTGAFQYFALAASLVLAVGFILGLDWRGAAIPEELAMGNAIVEHLYHEETEFAAIRAGEMTAAIPYSEVNRVLANAGANLGTSAQLSELRVLYANPCLVLPGHQSAHLILQSTQGPLSVIVINNSPVERELRIGDEQFSGMIIPFERGNLVLVGESGAEVSRYRDLFADGVNWVI